MTAAAELQLNHLYRPIAELCQPGEDEVVSGPGELGRGEDREVGGPGQPPPAHPGREVWRWAGRELLLFGSLSPSPETAVTNSGDRVAAQHMAL